MKAVLSIKSLPVELVIAVFVALTGMLLIDGGHFLVHWYAHVPLFSSASMLHEWALGHSGDDSWKPMRAAHEFTRLPQGETLYQYIFFSQHIKFQYPPSSLLMFLVSDAFHINLTVNILNDISWLSVALQAAATSFLGFVLLNKAGVADYARSNQVRGAFAALIFVCCMTFYPVLLSYELGQIQTWINCAFALACVLWVIDRRLIAGVFIGLICLIKPQLSLFLLWGALRKEWGFVLGWSAVVIPGELLSLKAFGFSNNVDYLAALHFMAHHGEAYFRNQSINGLLNRLIGNGNNLQWAANAFPPYNAIVYFGTLISSGLMIVVGILHRRNNGGVTPVSEFVFAGLLFTAASPIAWEHHYGILPLAFVILMVRLIAAPQSAAKIVFGVSLAIAYTLSAHSFPEANNLAASHANVLQSYLLFAVLIVLWLLHVVPEADEFSDERVMTMATPTRSAGLPSMAT
jgi:alpha-1,2-mannosyltransferase